ncbi:substrate-binding periplasmic protein [Colwellia sp. 75C3]|uniref:substrate-binding periplasmic protein n=1 Tax=Colwellia sp. 75C3 TaxID=888425 RepID=UPI0012FEB19E|nr:transporter substrate-binding domain-containing protein [Colwellia sp. 75C3]
MKDLLIICILLSINLKAYGADRVISVVSLVDYAPYVFVERNESVTGFISTQDGTELIKGYSWDVFKESFYSMGYSIKYIVVPWPRAIKLLEYGHVELLFPISKSDERLKIFNYSKESINVVDYVIYSANNSDFKWKGLDSLKGEIIGVKRGFNYGKKWQSLNTVTKYDIGHISDGFRMLEKGHVDGFIGYKESWDYVLKQEGWEHKFTNTPIIDSSLEYVVSMKGIEGNSKLLAVYDEGKRKLIKNGRLDVIKLKWFGLNKTKPNE